MLAFLFNLADPSSGIRACRSSIRSLRWLPASISWNGNSRWANRPERLSSHLITCCQVAAGNPLPLSQSAIPLVGHAFEARIYAENPRNQFLPDSGTLLYLSTPTPTHIFAPTLPLRTLGPSPSAAESADATHVVPSAEAAAAVQPSLRLEQGFGQGAQIGVFYDPMIAKLVVHGRDRAEALRMLRQGLDEYRVVGLHTNVEFLRTLAGNAAFIDGEVETGFIPVRAGGRAS